MSSAGPNSGGTFANVPVSGAFIWGSLSNAGASDNTYAFSSYGGGLSLTESDQLKATNFGFSIPGGATINGVVVEIEKKVSSAAFNTKDKTVQLVKGGTASGNNKASASVWPTSDAYSTYGSSSDLWGLTLTDSDINASNFGVIVTIQSDGTGKSSYAAYVDHIRITVYYTAGSSFIASKQRPIQQAIKRSNFY